MNVIEINHNSNKSIVIIFIATHISLGWYLHAIAFYQPPIFLKDLHTENNNN
jgi:hypothetical protein